MLDVKHLVSAARPVAAFVASGLPDRLTLLATTPEGGVWDAGDGYVLAVWDGTLLHVPVAAYCEVWERRHAPPCPLPLALDPAAALRGWIPWAAGDPIPRDVPPTIANTIVCLDVESPIEGDEALLYPLAEGGGFILVDDGFGECRWVGTDFEAKVLGFDLSTRNTIPAPPSSGPADPRHLTLLEGGWIRLHPSAIEHLGIRVGDTVVTSRDDDGVVRMRRENETD